MKPLLTKNLVFGLTLCASAIGSLSATEQTASTVVAGKARFTVITPTLLRLEWQPDGKFIDEPSFFAVNRSAGETKFAITRNGEALDLDTGSLRLHWKPNGQSFTPENLTVEVKSGQKWIPWQPGQKPKANLGGTIRTLDKIGSPLNLGLGLLARDGWALVDDSKSPLRPPGGWFANRPKDAGTDWYLFGYGLDYRMALRDLSTIGGAVPIPRKYLLGAWYSRYWNYSAKDFKDIVNEYTANNFPLDVLVMDMDWHVTTASKKIPGVKFNGWSGFTWNKDLIPDPKGLLDWIHGQGIKVTLNDHPAEGIQPCEEMYADFMKAAGADATSNSIIPFDAGDYSYLDRFWKFSHVPRENEGVDFWWLDWQQYPMTRSVDSLTNLMALNTFYYEKSTDGGGRGTSFSRWAGWGDHRHPIAFSGDAIIRWEMLAFEIPFTTAAGNVGCFFWSHDIGGHMKGLGRNDELYTRWVQFGTLSAALRSHSTRDKALDRRPWTYSKDACDAMRTAFHLRSRLFPYLYSSVIQSCRDTVPLTRPLYIDYPDQEPAYHNATEFLFGDHLLAAPICTPGVGPKCVASRPVWFPPASTWYDFFTNERHQGGEESLAAATLDEFPLYARGGTPIAMQPYTPRMGSDPLKTLTVKCWPGANSKSASVPFYEDDGLTTAYQQGEQATTTLTYARKGNRHTITVGPCSGKFANQMEQRAIDIALAAIAKPTAALLDGEPIEVSYDADSATATVHIPARSIRKASSISLVSEEADQAAIRSAVRQRRWQGILGKDIPNMTSALAACSTPEQRNAALAVGGYGLVTKNDAPYLYKGQDRLHAYAPKDAKVRVEPVTLNGTPMPKTSLSVSGTAPTLVDTLDSANNVRSVRATFPKIGTAEWNAAPEASKDARK